jgi:hypothetical protein
VEPIVPENPSEYELGRNWYWHHCMPCHGDVGQGLTDEFRAVWPDDHQNCWARGCHVGRQEDMGFPIPTVVPAIVNREALAQFSSLQALYEYLKATHPPQHPGYLQDEQYRAIAVYLFTLNHRLPDVPTPVPPSMPVSTPSPAATLVENPSRQQNTIVYLGIGIILVVLIVWGIRKRFRP